MLRRRKYSIKKNILYVTIATFLSLIIIFGFGYYVLLPNMWNYLVVNEEPDPVDVIIVLSGGPGRLNYGVELYKLGYSNKILITGGLEANMMSRQAQALGVSPDNIIIDDQSHTTFDNAKNSLEIMRARGLGSAIVVTSPYHTRRASIIFGHFSHGLHLIVCAIPYDSSVSNNWWKDSNTRFDVISEYLKLIYYYLFQIWT